MGKGYNNFMSKKAFHPGSFANQKRIHEAEARAEAKRKHDEETLAQYKKEQELLNQKSLISKESKEKLSLNFMYAPPPGISKHNDNKGSEKVEWTGSSSSSRTTINDINITGQTTAQGGPSICLEWKRDRPAKRTNKPTTEIKSEVKKEPSQGTDSGTPAKSEPKLEPKREPKQEEASQTRAVHGSTRKFSRDDHERQDVDRKRIKKER